MRTGKYLNVIQQCEQNKSRKTYYKAERSRPKTLVNPFKKPSDVTDTRMEDDNEDLRYFENPGRNIFTVKQRNNNDSFETPSGFL